MRVEVGAGEGEQYCFVVGIAGAFEAPQIVDGDRRGAQMTVAVAAKKASRNGVFLDMEADPVAALGKDGEDLGDGVFGERRSGGHCCGSSSSGRAS